MLMAAWLEKGSNQIKYSCRTSRGFLGVITRVLVVECCTLCRCPFVFPTSFNIFLILACHCKPISFLGHRDFGGQVNQCLKLFFFFFTYFMTFLNSLSSRKFTRSAVVFGWVVHFKVTSK